MPSISASWVMSISRSAFRVRLARHVHPARVAEPAVEDHRDVDVEDVAVLQPPLRRDAVADDVVDRDAAGVAVALVADRRRGGAGGAHHVVHRGVELDRRHARARPAARPGRGCRRPAARRRASRRSPRGRGCGCRPCSGGRAGYRPRRLLRSSSARHVASGRRHCKPARPISPPSSRPSCGRRRRRRPRRRRRRSRCREAASARRAARSAPRAPSGMASRVPSSAVITQA